MKIWTAVCRLFGFGGGPTPKRKLHHTQTAKYRRANSKRAKAIWAARRKAEVTPISKLKASWTPERRAQQAENARNQAIRRRLDIAKRKEAVALQEQKNGDITMTLGGHRFA